LVAAIEALGSPTLRIGGDSQDETAPAATAAHSGLTELPADFWTQVGCLERETGIPVVVGLNLAWGKPSWAAALAAGARAVIPRSRLSFELGNEPDTYGVPVPWWNGRALVNSRMPWRIYVSRARAGGGARPRREHRGSGLRLRALDREGPGARADAAPAEHRRSLLPARGLRRAR